MMNAVLFRRGTHGLQLYLAVFAMIQSTLVRRWWWWAGGVGWGGSVLHKSGVTLPIPAMSTARILKGRGCRQRLVEDDLRQSGIGNRPGDCESHQ